MAEVSPVRNTLLIAPLHSLDSSPHQLASPISIAASKSLKGLRIVLVSPLFYSSVEPPERKRGISRTHKWDEVQRLLTYVYVQATKAAQERNRVLMNIDVLLLPEGELVPDFLGTQADQVFRVSLSENGDGLENLPQSVSDHPSGTVWLEPTQYHPHPVLGPSSLTTPLHPTEGGIPPLFPVAALGGTFDHLHAGHKILLSMAAWITSQKLIIGVTDDALLKNKSNRHLLENLSVRTERVRQFLNLFRPDIQYDIVTINDVYGPTAWDPNIQALVVSKETLPGAAAIDKHRGEKSLPSLKTFVIDVISSTESNLDAEDTEALKQTKMGSTFIREWIARQPPQFNDD